MMGADTLLRWLVDGSMAATAAVLLVLALRRPLRRAFGARVAYGSWALVPLSLFAAALPRPGVGQGLAPDLVALHPGVLVVASADASRAMAGVHGIDWALVLAAAWLSGAALAAWRLVRQQRRFVAGLGPLERDAAGHWRGERVHGPAVVGALRPRIVLPVDFEARHAAEEAALVIAHERAHLARGDTRANLAAVALRCLQWFNPLMHLAERSFRLDQELACDATVLARHPHARRRYADAMLNVQLAVPGLPVGCHWQSSQSLKERILMLKRPQPGCGRRRTGLVALGLVLSACSYAAWAVRPAAAPDAPPAPPPPVTAQPPVPPDAPPAPPVMTPPRYPADAAAAGQDGRVVLKLLVDVEGRVKDVVVEQSEPAGVFDATTVEAARKWVLQPAIENGRPVEGWVRVPVDFEAPDPVPGPADGAKAQ